MRSGVVVLLVALAGLVILAAAPAPHVDGDALLYARIAANVLASGEWLTFHHPGWLVDKPPVVFWLMAGSFWLLGVSDAAMRLWQLLLALGLMGVTAAASRASGGSRVEGLLAALVLGTALQFFYQATAPGQDVALTFFLSCAVYGLLRYAQAGGVGWIMACGVAVALAVLTKGLAGLALFGAVALVAAVWVRRALPHPWRRVAAHAGAAAVTFAAVVLPWYAYGVWRQGEPFVRTFLTSGALGIGRFFRPVLTAPPPYGIAIFAYVPLLLLGTLPWTPAFLAGLPGLPGVVREGGVGARMVAAWFVGMFAVLSLSSGDKVFRYLLPVYPSVAILTARSLMGLLEDHRRLRAAGWLAVGPAVALAAAGFWSLWTAFPPARALLVAVVLPGIVMLVLAVAGFGAAALARAGRAAIVIAAAGAMAGYALYERSLVVHRAAVDPWPAIVAAAAPHAEANPRLVLYGRAAEWFNFAQFHFETPVSTVRSLAELGALWERQRLLVVVPLERADDLFALRPKPVVLLRSDARVLLVSNSPAPPR
jgi:4-amino-4-deoxy-L-arabinose transferase-like glycosyltransferase